MSRVPFLAGVPTALCRITSVWEFNNSNKSRGVESFVPNNDNLPVVIDMDYSSNRSRTSQFTGKVGLDDVLYYSFTPNAMIQKSRSGGNMMSPFCWTTAKGEDLQELPRNIGEYPDDEVR